MVRDSARARSLWIAVAAAWVAVTVASSLLYFVAPSPDGHRDLLRGLLLQGIVWAYWVALVPLIIRTTRRFPVRRPKPAALGVHASFAIVSVTVHALALTWLGYAAGYGLTEHPTSMWLRIMAAEAVLELFLYVSIVAAVTAVDAATEMRQRETQAAVLAADLSAARLDALRLQLQPHFVLNALNTVAILIRESAARDALDVVLDLGALLQGMLGNEGQQEHALDEEIAFLRRYLHIEGVRFADRLTTAIEVPDGLGSASVPRYVLQPIVENALRHGIGRSETGGRVTITGWRSGARLCLRVTDDGPGLPAALERGIGLANVQRRLDHLYGPEYQLAIGADASGATAATIALPYRVYPGRV